MSSDYCLSEKAKQSGELLHTLRGMKQYMIQSNMTVSPNVSFNILFKKRNPCMIEKSARTVSITSVDYLSLSPEFSILFQTSWFFLGYSYNDVASGLWFGEVVPLLGPLDWERKVERAFACLYLLFKSLGKKKEVVWLPRSVIFPFTLSS